MMKQAQGNTLGIDRLMFGGFCGLCFFIPVATSPAVILGLLTTSLWIFSGRFIKDSQWLGQEWTLPVIMMMLLPFIGLLYTEDVSAGMDFAKKSRYWLYTFAIASISLTEKNREMFLKAYVAGVTFTAALYVLQLLRIVPMKFADIAVTSQVGTITSIGLFNQWGHITFSLLIAFSLTLLSLFFKRAQSRKNRLVIIFLMSLQFIALAVLLSDGGHLAFILLSPIIAYNLLQHPRPLKVGALSALMVGALFLSPVTQSRFHDVVSGTLTYGESKSLTPVQGRFYMWTGALKIIADNPFFGIGTGGYQAAMRDMRINKVLPDKNVKEDPTQPHNSFLYMAVSFGIPGVAVLVWLFAVLLRNGWRNRHSILGFSVLAFTFVLLIGSLTDSQILSAQTAALFALFTGLQGHLADDS